MTLKLNKNEKKALKDYIESLEKHFPGLVEKVILFGSKARGDSRKHSDIDVVVATNKKVSHSVWENMIELTVDTMLKYETDISPLIQEAKWLQEWSPLVHYHINKDGIELWNKKGKNLLD